MSQKRILQLSSNVGFFGAENVILELSKELSRSPYRPIIGVFHNTQNPHTELVKMAKEQNIETAIFRCDGRIDLRTVRSIRRFVNDRNIGIIHSHGYKTNFYALLAAKSRNIPLVATCHPWINSNLILRLYNRLDQKLLHRFDKIVAISAEVKQQILNKKVVEAKVTIIDNGIDITRFKKDVNTDALRREFNIDPKMRIVGTIGRLSEEKGHSCLIAAAKMVLENFSDLLFVIVGDGPMRPKLEKQVNELGLIEHILFTGVRSDIPQMLAMMDMFVLPSLTEGLPMVLLEAMAAGKPIVSTCVGQIPRIMGRNEAGILVSPNNPKQMNEAITQLLNDKALGRSLAKKAQVKVNNEFSSEQMARQYIRIYDELLENRN